MENLLPTKKRGLSWTLEVFPYRSHADERGTVLVSRHVNWTYYRKEIYCFKVEAQWWFRLQCKPRWISTFHHCRLGQPTQRRYVRLCAARWFVAKWVNLVRTIAWTAGLKCTIFKVCGNRYGQRNLLERHLRDKHHVEYLEYLYQEELEVQRQRWDLLSLWQSYY